MNHLRASNCAYFEGALAKKSFPRFLLPPLTTARHICAGHRLRVSQRLIVRGRFNLSRVRERAFLLFLHPRPKINEASVIFPNARGGDAPLHNECRKARKARYFCFIYVSAVQSSELVQKLRPISNSRLLDGGEEGISW